MLTLVALSLVASVPTPSPAPSATCGACSLTGRLFAQTAPPLPGDAPPAVDREHELELQIDALNTQIRSIDVNWPTQYVVIGYAGYVLGPGGLLTGAMFMLLGLQFNSSPGLSNLAGTFITLGAVSLALGALALAAIVYAWINGSAVASQNREKRDGLIQEREKLEEELHRIRRAPEPSVRMVRAPFQVTLLRF